MTFFVFYARKESKAKNIYGMINKKYITSIFPSKDQTFSDKDQININKKYFCNKNVKDVDDIAKIEVN